MKVKKIDGSHKTDPQNDKKFKINAILFQSRHSSEDYKFASKKGTRHHDVMYADIGEGIKTKTLETQVNFYKTAKSKMVLDKRIKSLKHANGMRTFTEFGPGQENNLTVGFKNSIKNGKRTTVGPLKSSTNQNLKSLQSANPVS